VKLSNKNILRQYIREAIQQDIKPIQKEGIGNVVLDIAGLIPGVGEPFDLLNAIDYARKGEYLFAALSLISVIPEIGDIVGKGGKVTVWLTKSFPKASKFVGKFGPDVVDNIKKAKEVIKQNQSLIKEIFDKVEKKAEEDKKFTEITKHLQKLKDALNVFADLDENNPDLKQLKPYGVAS